MKFFNIFVNVLKNFGDFKSRSNKTEFWVFILVSIILSFILGLLHSHILNLIYSLVIFVPSIAVGARRLHDIGKSGWTQLWMITIVGIVYLIVLWIKDGEASANKWGNVPKKIEL